MLNNECIIKYANVHKIGHSRKIHSIMVKYGEVFR